MSQINSNEPLPMPPIVELRPCPFCQSTALAVREGEEQDFTVQCDACGAQGPVSRDDHEPAAKAMLFWNKRAAVRT